ncbi:MAG: hypothetical protein Q7S76_02795 [bacterium]|nr:hypothetical protein [bacterium]
MTLQELSPSTGMRPLHADTFAAFGKEEGMCQAEFSVIRQIIRDAGIANGDIWYSRPPQATSILVEWHKGVAETIELIEITENRGGTARNARIYLSPRDNDVPTLIIGDQETVGRASWWDKQPMYPLHGRCVMRLGNQDFVFPDEVENFPGMRSVLGENARLFYLVRSSSFTLDAVTEHRVSDGRIVTQWYVNRLTDFGEFFAFASPPGESGFLPGLATPRLLMTNSLVYRDKHPQWDFRRVI